MKNQRKVGSEEYMNEDEKVLKYLINNENEIIIKNEEQKLKLLTESTKIPHIVKKKLWKTSRNCKKSI